MPSEAPVRFLHSFVQPSSIALLLGVLMHAYLFGIEIMNG